MLFNWYGKVSYIEKQEVWDFNLPHMGGKLNWHYDNIYIYIITDLIEGFKLRNLLNHVITLLNRMI